MYSGHQASPPELLNELYQGALDPGSWPVFLHKLGAMFRCDTATLRVTDNRDPVVYASYTVGFDDSVEQLYRQGAVADDPFRKSLAEGPLGVIQRSHDILADREFVNTDFYQKVFRPNGNFYAMGAHFHRTPGNAMHLGVHRTYSDGPFSRKERQTLEFFSPHLHRAAELCQLVGSFENALSQARAALDRLPSAVWLLDEGLRCQWMNLSARQVLSAQGFALTLNGQRSLGFSDNQKSTQLRQALQRVRDGGSPVASVPVGPGGASLVVLDYRDGSARFSLTRREDVGLLVFLLDPARTLTLNHRELRARYGLTPAEIRLAGQLVQGQDPAQASHCLGISVHTVRTQLKSVMHKMDVSRQVELIRMLLLGYASLSQDLPHNSDRPFPDRLLRGATDAGAS